MGEISVTVVDALIVLVILMSAGYAAYRGLMRETLSIFSWAVSAYVTLRFFPSFQPMLRGFISPEWLADFIVLVSLFLVMLVPLSFLSFRFAESVRRSEIGPVDRSLGFVFGVARGLVILGLVYIAFFAMAQGNDPVWLREARLYPLIQNTREVLLTLVPEEESLPGGVFAGPAVVTTPAAVPPSPVAQPAAPAQADTPPPAPTYDADERGALDRLIEATATDGNNVQ